MAWTRVNAGKTAPTDTFAASNTHTLTTASLTVGNRLFVFAFATYGLASGSISSPPSDGHNTYTLWATAAGSDGGGQYSGPVNIYSAPITTGGVQNIACTVSGASADNVLALAYLEYSGLDTSAGVGARDAFGSTTFTNATTTGTATTSTTTAANQLVLSASHNFADTTNAYSWGSGTPTETKITAASTDNDGISTTVVGEGTLASGTTATAAWTLSGADQGALVVVVCKLGAAIPDTPVAVPVLAATTVLPAPTIVARVNASVAVAALAATATLPAPTVVIPNVNASVAPSVLAATAVLPGPTITAGTSVSAGVGVLAATAQLPAPAIFTGSITSASVAVDPVAAKAVLPGPAERSTVTLAVASLAAAAAIPAPSVSTGAVVNASVSIPALAATVALPASFDSPAFQADPLAATTVLPAPAVAAQARLAVGALAATTTLGPPGVAAGFLNPASISPAAVAATSQLPAPVVTFTQTAGPSVNPVAATVGVPAPAVIAQSRLAFSPVAATVQILLPPSQFTVGSLTALAVGTQAQLTATVARTGGPS